MAPLPGTRAATARAHLASTCALAARAGETPDPDIIAGLRRNLRAAKASDYLEQIIGGWPPLTPAQIADLAAIIDAAPADDSTAA